jgi:small subunit ribosomal protein S6
MNTYELTVVTADKSVMEKVAKTIKDKVKKAKGDVNKEEEWGDKMMAYPIKKNANGFYQHYVLTMEGKDQLELDLVMRIDEQILRYLFVKV